MGKMALDGGGPIRILNLFDKYQNVIVWIFHKKDKK